MRQHVANTPEEIENNLSDLCAYLAVPAVDDSAKVVSIYQWLIENIRYDSKAYRDGNKRINRSNQDILNRKRAVCWGFSTLFHAMCEEVAISSVVISGYGKPNLDSLLDLESPNHAWNAVRINSRWYLLDATWDSGNLATNSENELSKTYSYFLAAPDRFVLSHLPNDPAWQLLDCPISPEEYLMPVDSITQIVKQKDCGVAYHQATKVDWSMSVQDRRLLDAIRTYEYHPTESNRRQLAHAQLDYEAYLTEIAEKLQIAKQYDSLLIVQSRMIQLCETATRLTHLFDTQLENCAYNFFNYAVTLTQINDKQEKTPVALWQEVKMNFMRAQSNLIDLPQNMFTENALSLCEDYIEYAESMIEKLE
ncbi:MAG: transglutaminase domain-containing protein [Bacteroidota bacterium]